jgi:hypothetical protein
MFRRVFLLVFVLGTLSLRAQTPADLAADEGLWHGYDGELRYASRLLVALAESIPADKWVDAPSLWEPLLGLALPVFGYVVCWGIVPVLAWVLLGFAES